MLTHYLHQGYGIIYSQSVLSKYVCDDKEHQWPFTSIMHWTWSHTLCTHVSSPLFKRPSFGLPRWGSGKEPTANAPETRDASVIPGLRGAPGEGNGSPLQCSCLENPMDRGAWWAAVHGVAESPTRLSDWTATTRGLSEVWSLRQKRGGIKRWPDGLPLGSEGGLAMFVQVQGR